MYFKGLLDSIQEKKTEEIYVFLLLNTQSMLWFNFHFPLFHNNYHSLLHTKTKENET